MRNMIIGAAFFLSLLGSLPAVAVECEKGNKEDIVMQAVTQLAPSFPDTRIVDLTPDFFKAFKAAMIADQGSDPFEPETVQAVLVEVKSAGVSFVVELDKDECMTFPPQQAPYQQIRNLLDKTMAKDL
jgi:hypothetical protein